MAWPKPIPVLSAELQQKKKDWEIYWLNLHPVDNKYSFMNKFTIDFVCRSMPKKTDRVLEIGPGPNPALKYLDLDPANYYAVERGAEFVEELARSVPRQNILDEDVSAGIDFGGIRFDKIIAAHVLEHLLDLPSVMLDMKRLLQPSGHIDIVLPCEGSVLYTIGRKFSSEREYKKKFGAGFKEIMKSDHVNDIFEVFDEVKRHFRVGESTCFPVPLAASKIAFQLNLLVGLRVT